MGSGRRSGLDMRLRNSWAVALRLKGRIEQRHRASRFLGRRNHALQTLCRRPVRSCLRHRSQGCPGIDPGSGWMQDLDLMISEGMLGSSSTESPEKLD